MSVVAPLPDRATTGAGEVGGRGRAGRVVRALANSSAIVGLLIVGGFAVCAIFAPLIAPHDPIISQPDGLSPLGEPLAPGADWSYPLGTDEIGRDLLSRLIYGARVAMFIAVVPNVLAVAIATLIGVTAGYARGRTEAILMRLTEIVMVLPAFLIALALLAVLGTGLGVIVAALVIVTWTYPARVIYGEVLRIREEPFVEAARVIGSGPFRIVYRHVLPQLWSLLVVYLTLNAAFMVLLEAGLSFLGFGVQPPTPSWGAMIGQSRDLFFWPWLIVLPGACLALLGIGFYLLGEGIQRSLRPQRPKVRLR